MAKCPLCSSRAAKRYCPAKQTQICAVCCGTKREVEIDCPSDCIHLKTGRAYEAKKKVLAPEAAGRVRRFDDTFVYEFSPVIIEIYRAVLADRRVWPSVVDHDVLEVYRSLAATMKTLSSGLYYESLPEGGTLQVALFRRLKSVLDTLMAPQTSGRRSLRVSEALDVLEFLAASAEWTASDRPKSRKYLDWLQGMVPEVLASSEASRLIVR